MSQKKLFFKLYFYDSTHEFDYTICRNMAEVGNYLCHDDTRLGDDISAGGDDDIEPRVQVSGIWMTEDEYQEWADENGVGTKR